jgi:hypothetical protein
MSTSWSTKQEAVRLAVATAMGVPDRLGADNLTTIKEVMWENQRDAAGRWGSDDKPTINLRLGNIRNHGNDERRDVYDELNDRIRTYFCGQRHFTVSVTVMIPNQLAGKEAVGEWGSRLRTRMRADRIHALYAAADVALVRLMETQNADELEINGRMMSVAVTDLRFATTEEWEDNDTENGDFIARVEADGELLKPGEPEDGEFVAADIDTDRELPPSP